MSLPTLEELLALRAIAQGCTLRQPGTGAATPPGPQRGLRRGRGLEFEEVRAYVAGDDVRSIHWRVTARRGRPHTKLFREERERPVWLLVDLHPGMFFGSRLQLKSALALRAAALLAWAAVRDGDRVGAVIVAGAGASTLAPRGRDAGVLPLLTELVRLQPCAPAALAGPARLEAGLRSLATLVRPGSLVLLLSDFAQLAGAREDLWLALAERGDCRLFPISDPLERQGLPAGRYRGGLVDALRWFDGTRLRREWQATWRQRELWLEGLAGRLQAPIVALDTAEPVAHSLAPRLQGSRRVA